MPTSPPKVKRKKNNNESEQKNTSSKLPDELIDQVKDKHLQDALRAIAQGKKDVNHTIASANATALHVVLLMENLGDDNAIASVVKALLALGADVNAEGGHDKTTPLAYAMLRKKATPPAIVQTLIDAGAPLNRKEDGILLQAALKAASGGENDMKNLDILLGANKFDFGKEYNKSVANKLRKQKKAKYPQSAGDAVKEKRATYSKVIEKLIQAEIT